MKLSENLKRTGRIYQYVSAVVLVVSLGCIFLKVKPTKPFVNYGVAVSLYSLLSLGLQRRDLLDDVEKFESDESELVRIKSNKLDTLTDENRTLETKLVELNEHKLVLKSSVLELTNRLESIGKFNTETVNLLLNEAYQTGIKKCQGHIEGLIRNYPEVKEKLDCVLDELSQKRVRFDERFIEFKRVDNFGELLDVGMEIQRFVITTCIELRCKAQSIVINHLDSNVPFEDFEKYIGELTTVSKNRITSTEEKRLADLKSMANEFQNIISEHGNVYVTDVDNALITAKDALGKIESLKSELNVTIQKLDELDRPCEFPGHSNVVNVSNAVSSYYYNRYKLTLDGLHWEETETGFKTVYSVRRNPWLSELELTADNSLNMVSVLVNCLPNTEPKFEFDRQCSTCSMSVVWRLTTRKKNELPRGVVTSDKFYEIVKNWRRVRVTGGSESGKTPTAENMVNCILRDTDGTVEFFDPQFDSVKNYREIPVSGKSHEDSVRGLINYAKRMDDEPSDKFYLGWFDEIDTTLETDKEAVKHLKTILKQCSHKNSGLIITGQNANVRNLKGLDRSDLNNFVSVHIGVNYRDAVNNSHLSEGEKKALLTRGEKLMEYCIEVNREECLDSNDPFAIRFALVIEPNKLPYYMLLPEFGLYKWDGRETVKTIDDEPTCKSCNSPLSRNGKTSKGQQRYICKSCKTNVVMDV